MPGKRSKRSAFCCRKGIKESTFYNWLAKAKKTTNNSCDAFVELPIAVQPGSTDLRKAATGLAVPVEEEMGEKPLSGHILFAIKPHTAKRLVV